jgi:hypothetical protein
MSIQYYEKLLSSQLQEPIAEMREKTEAFQRDKTHLHQKPNRAGVSWFAWKHRAYYRKLGVFKISRTIKGEISV